MTRSDILKLNIFLLLILFSIPFFLQSEEIKHNIDFQHQGNLWILPSDMHDSLYIKIEFAESVTEQMQGLMYRETMEPDEGMLFIYAYPQRMNFWMKNTHIPLDLIFIDEAGTIVDLAENTIPFSEKNIPSFVTSIYVLEVNAGYCERNFIIIGDRVIWEDIR